MLGWLILMVCLFIIVVFHDIFEDVFMWFLAGMLFLIFLMFTTPNDFKRKEDK